MGFSLSGRPLSSHVREKSHESSAFDGERELALIDGAHFGSLLAHDASMRVEELLEDVRVLIVYVLNVVLLEEALLGHIRCLM